MDAAQLDVEGREVPATEVGPPAPPPPRPKPATRPELARPEPTPGQLDLDQPLGVDALFPPPT